MSSFTDYMVKMQAKHRDWFASPKESHVRFIKVKPEDMLVLLEHAYLSGQMSAQEDLKKVVGDGLPEFFRGITSS